MNPSERIFHAATEAGWKTQPLWSIARRVTERDWAQGELLSVYREWGVVPRSSRDDNHNRASEDLSSYQRVRRGDLVLNKMKTWQGSLAVSQYDGIVSPAYFVCRLSETVHPRFAHYLLRSRLYVDLYAALSKGIRPNQWDLPYDEFRTVPVILPPLDVQRSVATFLDAQVARIDEIVRLREAQIDALEQRHRSVLAEAISGSLTGHRGFRNHSLLGPVAADWPITAVKHVVKKVGVGLVINPSTYVTDKGVPFLLGRNVRDGWFDFANLNHMSVADSRRLSASRLGAGDVVVVRAGYPGRAAVVPAELEGANCASILILRQPHGVLPDFLAAFFNSPQGRAQVRLAQYGAAQEQINVGDVVDFQIPVPPRSDQETLLARLNEQSFAVRRLRDEMQKQVAITKERKQSMISAAVTGNFEVAALTGRGL